MQVVHIHFIFKYISLFLLFPSFPILLCLYTCYILSVGLFSFNSENFYPNCYTYKCIFTSCSNRKWKEKTHTYYLCADAVECTFHWNASLDSTELSSALSSQGSCCEAVSVVAYCRHSLEITARQENGLFDWLLGKKRTTFL